MSHLAGKDDLGAGQMGHYATPAPGCCVQDL